MSDGNGAMPEGWEKATIEELCSLNPKHDRDLPEDTEVSFVPMAAVSDVLGTITDPQIRPFGEVRKGYTHFADGDVIFAKITPCMENGKAASVRGMTNGLACGTTEFYVFRSHGAIDQDYLYRFIRQESYRNAARAQMQSGVGQARVPKDFVLSTTLPVPPLAEQRRIVAKIESLQERSSRARRALSEVGPLLEQFRQSVLAAAFSGRLTADWRAAHRDVEPATELREAESLVTKKKSEQAQGFDAVRHVAPDEWPIAKLGNIFTFIDYRGKNPKKSKSGRRLITAKNIRMGYLQDEPVEYVSEDTYISWMTRGFPKEGDILFVTEGHTMGFVAVNDREDDFALAQRTITLQPPEGIDSRCFFYFLMSPSIQRLIELNATGSAAKGVKGARFRDFPIPFPCYAEQVEIARRVAEMFEFVDGIETELAEPESSLAQLDQSILAKAFRGELVPQDPRDEPASELLARIRQQREQAESDKKSIRTKGKAKGNRKKQSRKAGA